VSTGASSTFGDFVTYDFGTIASPGQRFGVARPVGATIAVLGRLLLGTTGTSVTFADDARIISFGGTHGDLSVDADFNGITIAANASSTVTLGANGSNTFLAEDPTNAPFDFIVDGAGTVYSYGDVFDGYRIMTLQSGVSFDGTIIKNGGQITLNGATLDNCQLSGYTGATATAQVVTDDLADISNCAFVAGANGHAIEITAPGTYAFIGNTFSGYGASGSGEAAIYNNSGGLVTINVTDGDTPTITNGSGASTQVNNTKTHTLTGLVNGSEVTYMQKIHDKTDLAITSASGANCTLTSISTDLMVIKNGYYIALYNFGTPANNGIYVATGDGTATSVTLTKQYTPNPSNEGAGATVDLEVELFHAENVTGNETNFGYEYAAGTVVRIQVHHKDYLYLQVDNYTLPSGSTELPVEQVADVNYSNP